MSPNTNHHHRSTVAWVATATTVTSGLVLVASTLWWRKQQRDALERTLDDSPTDSVAPPPTDDTGPVREIQWNTSRPDATSATNADGEEEERTFRRILTRGCVTIVHGSVTGTCAQFASVLYQSLLRNPPHATTSRTGGTSKRSTADNVTHVQMGSIEDFDWWDELINDETVETASHQGSNTMATLIVLLPTYTNGTWPPKATPLQEALQELQNDWRIAAKPVKHKLQAAVFGMGSSAYNTPDNATTGTTTTTAITTGSITAPTNASTTTSKNGMDNNMGQPAKEAIKALQKLGAKVLVKLAIGDDAVGQHAAQTFEAWHAAVRKQLSCEGTTGTMSHTTNAPLTTKGKASAKPTIPVTNDNHSSCACGEASSSNPTSDSTTTEAKVKSKCCQENSESSDKGMCNDTNKNHDHGGCCNSKEQDELEPIEENDSDDDVPESDDDDGDSVDDDDDDDDDNEPDVMDLEDIGDAMVASRRPKTTKGVNGEPPEMVTPSQAVALKKEGYKLIGTHSAVKLCRWTKHQLRGRGGCYKHTFYGITSYQCMEATPSLACANKCVFCWRHHKNPVGKEWRWKTDDPYFIVDQAVQTHVQMIKETRGIPGLQLDRWHEAHTVKHCALSLVGEPIMYPRIDELLGELHHRHISTFLVTNGQHPHAIATLRPITQLYVSVDAPTEPSLIAIDRPLFSDAWDRLKLSLSSLKDKGQRTVARLTVVKGWNSDEVSGYAQLIALGEVSLVEVKGVTFCGKSDASNLNMTNSPWHHEVVELTRTLQQELAQLRRTTHPHIPEYDLACEHKHSCSVLLARVDQFADDTSGGRRLWRTWIDYDKFQNLALQYAADPTCTFTVRDYTAPTPDWALFGAVEEGFDPTDRRHRKQTKHPKYTRFDTQGVPTHDDNDSALSNQERDRLAKMMKERKRQIGDGSTVTELRGGEKEILDASLMFRGLVVAK